MDYDLKIVMEDVEMLEAGDEVIAEGDYYKAPTISDVRLYNNACTGALGIGETVSDMLTFRINDPRSLVNDGARVDFYILATDLEGEDTLMSIEDEVGSTATDEILADDEDEKTGYVDEDDEDAEIDEEDEDEEDADPEDAQDAAEVDADLADGADATMEGEDIEEGEEDIDDESEEDDAEWEHIGVFYVYGQKTDVDGSLLITCFDGLARMTGNFIPESATATVAEMYADLADKVSEDCGIELEELEFDAIEEQEINWNFTATYREAFGYFAGLLGGYAEFDEDGVLGVSWYTYDDDILIKSELLNYEEDSSGEMTVENLVCSCGRSALSGAILEAGSGGQSASFSNPFMTQSQLDGIFELYKGIRFTGATLTALWDDELTAGKFIRIMTEDEYTNYLQIRNYIAQNADSQDSDVIARLPELRDGMNSLGRIILISRQVIDFKGEAMTLITSTCGSEAAKDSVATPQLNQAVSDAMQAMNAIEADIEDLEERVDAAEDAMEEVESDISALGTRVTTAEGNITTVEGNIVTLQGRVDDAEEEVDDTLRRLSVAQDVAGTLEWLTKHGTMDHTQDQAIDPTHIYFVVDPSGDYVVGSTHYSLVREPVAADLSTYYELTVTDSVNNYVATHLSVTSEGLWLLPDSGGNKVLIAVGGQEHTYPDAGTYIIGPGNAVIGKFTTRGAQIGKSNESNLIIGPQSMSLVDKNGEEYLCVEDLTDSEGYIKEIFIGDGTTAKFDLTLMAYGTTGNYMREYINGVEVTNCTETQTYVIFASPPGLGDEVLIRYKPMNDSYVNKAKYYTFGLRNERVGKGVMSIVTGENNAATRIAAHAEGKDTIAKGAWSHSEGQGTIAAETGQHAEGKYNVEMGAAYYFIIGNGSADMNRSNAFAVKATGDVYAAGDVYAGCDYDSTGGSKVLTNLSGMISISTESFSTGTLGSGGTKTGTKDITKANHYPVGIVGWNPDGSGQSLMNLYNCHLTNRQTGSAKIDWGVRNLSSSNSYSWTIYVAILWLRVA